ncbi:hypothetical protein AKJ09_10713 [Labilithrix luteola]|uniref:Uncharacterized protein n=1 Tax=Labilithrix luteola TaxID=1391654 RepID=A0A0K1QF38_9BACT|nr:hypothetical protein [Labilithrix luteola]AKV04050.1 hypothetical protein AKJ09_10713 [Labilithrix luteola]
MIHPSAVASSNAPRYPTLRARWGSGSGELGHERPAEGNPEGPMSFARAGDELVVLDQVNRQLVRFDGSGRVVATTNVSRTTQDLALAKDGSAVLLDRLGGQNVTVIDARGRTIGELPLGSRAGEPGLVTGVFVDDRTIYVEKEHGSLVPIGTLDARAVDPNAPSLAGRPSKDGALLLMAGLSSPIEGRAFVNATDRKTGALRFARTIQFPRPAQSIALLDSDGRGTIYLGIAYDSPPTTSVACLAPGDGHVIGRVTLPASAAPEESLRDLAVGDDGTIVYAVRTDDGVEYRSATCPPTS